MLQMLLVKHHIRTYNTSALRTVRYALALQNKIESILLTAVQAVIAEYRSMQFDRRRTACHLMQIIDILGNGRLQLTLFLQTDKGTPRCEL